MLPKTGTGGVSSANDILQILSSRRFVLVSGKAGSGKSYVLRKLFDVLTDCNISVSVVAPTGVAAINANGTTIHRWLGVSCDLRANTYKRDHKTINTQVLLIDEVSMVSCDVFEYIDLFMRSRKRSTIPFGGLKIVMFGDFLQLPPITSQKQKFIFQSKLWSDINVYRYTLTSSHRHGDLQYLKILNEVRIGKMSPSSKKILSERVLLPPEGTLFTRLCVYRKKAAQFNQSELDNIQKPSTTFSCKISLRSNTNGNVTQNDWKSYKKTMWFIEKFVPVPKELILKVGATVMMRCNTLLGSGICNGSTGKVLSCGLNCVRVSFEGGVVVDIEPYKFIVKNNDSSHVIFEQIPLSLAWAITIHKAQGLTIDCALVDTDCFECGQLYTALSRVRNLNSLFIDTLYDDGLIINEDAITFESP
jgi:ATP-dependent DNA helicase PIF1